ncbi:hypothetical protein pb186bvf_002408 [Paramecium bursaria]
MIYNKLKSRIHYQMCDQIINKIYLQTNNEMKQKYQKNNILYFKLQDT